MWVRAPLWGSPASSMARRTVSRISSSFIKPPCGRAERVCAGAADDAVEEAPAAPSRSALHPAHSIAHNAAMR
ncbi:hypothetical protein GCM10022416_45050 [Actinomadura keratinilytica]|uniref:Uncharacterized protein n=1 Tax=Actinomadura keratinilytica TaxID=547461 RepID=A0ABP7Z8Y8_9ACTN